MAIIKPFETPQGVIATYHKVLKAEISVASMSVECTVAVYASPEKRDLGSTVLWHEYISIPFSALNQDPRDLLYSILESFNGSYLFGGVSDVVATTTTQIVPRIQLVPQVTTALVASPQVTVVPIVLPTAPALTSQLPVAPVVVPQLTVPLI